MESNELFDESRLLIAFQTKDDAVAFEEIYKHYWFKLYSWAFSHSLSKQESEEMVQIVFERLWKNRHKVQIRNLGAYLAVSIRNILYDFQRMKATIKKARENYTSDSIHNATEEDINYKLLLEALENILQELPSKTQTVFRMSRYEDKSVREIADNLHVTEKAVEYHITKALKLIRNRLKGYYHYLF